MADPITLTLSQGHIWSAVALLATAIGVLAKYIAVMEKTKILKEIAAVEASQKENLQQIKTSLETLAKLIDDMEKNFYSLDKRLSISIALQRGHHEHTE